MTGRVSHPRTPPFKGVVAADDLASYDALEETRELGLLDGIVFLPLRNGNTGRVLDYAIVDAEYSEWANQWAWRLSNDGYAWRSIGGRTGAKMPSGDRANGRAIMLHRELLGLADADPLCTDHVNRNRLDERLENLRPLTSQENAQNRKRRRGTTAPARNVSYSTFHQRYLVNVMAFNQKHFGGAHRTLEAAVASAAFIRAQVVPMLTDEEYEG